MLGPHNNQLHRISKAADAFKVRIQKIDEQLKKDILLKRDALIAHIHRLTYRIEEMKYVRTIIERDSKSEHQGLNERLKAAEIEKTSILQQ